MKIDWFVFTPHFILTFQRPFDYDNQPRPLLSAQPFDINPNFNRYNDLPQSNSFSGGGLLGKRPMNDQPWQSHSSQKYSGPQGGPKRKFNSNPGPKANLSRSELSAQGWQVFNNKNSQNRSQWNKPQPSKGPKPKSSFPSQRFNNPKVNKPEQKDFKPSKVSKAKTAAPTNKLASYGTSERAKLVNKALEEDKDPNFILRDDQVPSQQLAGRLELALGHILKEIKAKYADSESNTASFQTMFVQRQMKQAIRERLRGVMMGKYVGKIGPIVESYRKVFPDSTDAEIVQIALDAKESNEAKQLAIKFVDAGSYNVMFCPFFLFFLLFFSR